MFFNILSVFGAIAGVVFFVMVLVALSMRQNPDLVIKWKVGKGAIRPFMAHDTDAGFDFFAPKSVTIPPKSTVKIDTRVSWEPNRHCYMQIQGRSGLAFNYGIEATNAGVIDENYRGSIGIKLFNTTDIQYEIKAGDRIAQGVVIMLPKIRSMKSDSLSSSDRGTSGFGGSGK